MATERQKAAARKNLEKARSVRAARAHGRGHSSRGTTHDLSTADRDRMPDDAFAFREKRKEPIVDAEHVRNAIARFDQVEGVSDAERDRAWHRIRAAAARYDVEVEAKDWRELMRH